MTIKKESNEWWEKALIIFAGAILLGFQAYINKFPLLYSDTGTHLASAWENFYPNDRPIFYGFFIYIFSMKSSLWLVLFSQCLLTSSFLYILFKKFAPRHLVNITFLFTIALLSFFTSASITASWLIPDIFAPILLLGLIVYLSARNLSITEQIFLLIIIAVSILMNNAYAMIAVGFCMAATILFLLYRKIMLIGFKRLVLAWAAVLLATFLLPFSNYLYNDDFEFSSGSHVFLIGSLATTGLLDSYLEEYCDTKDYTLCEYQNQLPMDFIWSNESPVKRAGGWERTKVEYEKILEDFLTTPKYLKYFIISSLEKSVRQFFYYDIEELQLADESMPPVHLIRQYLPFEAPKQFRSKQTFGLMEFTLIRHSHNFLAAAGITFLLIVLLVPRIRKRLKAEEKLLAILIITGLVVNAIICATFSTVSLRYQNRVVWLGITFTILLLTTKSVRHAFMNLFKSQY